MLRVVAIGLALCALAVACALVEPPQPVGTYRMEAEVRNGSPGPVAFTVRRALGGALPGMGVIEGGVQPASVPPGTSSIVFYLPTDGNWLIEIPGWGEIEGKDFRGFLALQCRPLLIEFEGDGAWGWPGCA
ncbi:MAG TPA: hypothetical protein VFU17_10295 [Candidatus Limnocylindrales bacterium]|nr:hypothetical protein [Candidatus Limnocylindrales bacterium]